MIRDSKKVPIKTLQKGNKFSTLITPTSNRFGKFEIIELSDAFVKLKIFDKFEETISTEGCFVEVPLTDEEFRAKYEDAAASIVELLREPIYSYPQGYHEMDNSWIEIDAYEFASTCKRKNITLIGWFPLTQKRICGKDIILDIGIIVRDNYPHDHDTYWCHASKKWIDHLIEDWDNAHQK